MAQVDSIDLLNRLFEIEHRSLLTYLTDACPWTHSGEEKATTALAHIAADQQAMTVRIAELIDSRGGRIDSGSFPMYFTDTNLLSLDFMLRELVKHQKHDIAEIVRIVAMLGADREARELAEEILGSERAHLEVLEDLAIQPA
ncbi:MAG TPA: ferritin-like domain-containing protein [Pirellulales bacterium]|jgi:hypothetical protein